MAGLGWKENEALKISKKIHNLLRTFLAGPRLFLACPGQPCHCNASARVDGGRPNLAAAPHRPDTRPRVSARAAPIISRSSLADLGNHAGDAGSVEKLSRGSQLWLMARPPSRWTITERSITFCNSRISLGQRYRISAYIDSGEIPSIWEPARQKRTRESLRREKRIGRWKHTPEGRRVPRR